MINKYDQTFEDISVNCRYGHWGHEGRSGNNFGFEWTCRNKNNIPKGHSWGTCSERECPLLPREVTNVKLFNSNGELIGTADNAIYFKRI